MVPSISRGPAPAAPEEMTRWHTPQHPTWEKSGSQSRPRRPQFPCLGPQVQQVATRRWHGAVLTRAQSTSIDFNKQGQQMNLPNQTSFTENDDGNDNGASSEIFS